MESSKAYSWQSPFADHPPYMLLMIAGATRKLCCREMTRLVQPVAFNWAFALIWFAASCGHAAQRGAIAQLVRRYLGSKSILPKEALNFLRKRSILTRGVTGDFPGYRSTPPLQFYQCSLDLLPAIDDTSAELDAWQHASLREVL